MPARWPSAAKPASAAWPSRSKSSPPSRRCCAAPARWPAGACWSPSGPTSEPIDPVRFIANRSSGKQGHAIAAAAAAAGADVVLVCGPVDLPDPPGVTVVQVETARKCWRRSRRRCRPTSRCLPPPSPTGAPQRRANSKIKKQQGRPPTLELVENPDILSTIAHRKSGRPRLVIGFAAETDHVDRQCQGEACEERLRLDPRQRRLAGNRHHGRRQQHDSLDHRRRRRILAAAVEGRRGARVDRADRRRA